VLGSAWLMDVAGLSMGLGAFLAGVLLADSEFRHELEAQVEPFKGLALGLFFMAVGMSIDVDQVLAEPLTIAIGVLLLMLVKFTLILLVGRTAGGLDRREAWLLGGVLALGGEFGFVIFAEAFKAGLLDGPMRDRLVAIIGVSMALTPLLLLAITRLLRIPPAAPASFDAIPDGHPSVLIAGFGRFGQIVARLLSAQRIPFVAIEHSQEQVEFVRRFGNVVFYGDPAHAELLRSAGAARVKVFVIAIDDAESSLRTVRVVRRHYPDAVVFARARNRRHAWELMDLGAQVVRETFHSSLVMGERVLVALGADEEAAGRDAQRFREHDEALLRSQYLVHDDEQALLQSAQAARRELEELFGADRGEGVLGGLVRRDGGERKGRERAPESGSG